MLNGDYRAVSIRHSATCCGSARALDSKRFLSNNAPSLPLANCTTPGLCQCEYRILTDRRDDFQPAARPPAQAGYRTTFKSLAIKLLTGRRTTDIA